MAEAGGFRQRPGAVMTDHVPAVRVAERRDLPLLQGIEAAAAELFVPLMDTEHWDRPSTGQWRAEAGGLLVVIGDPAVGFAHVVQIDGHFHLEQIAIHPDYGRQGLGTELLYSVIDLVADRGGDSLSLMAFADVPWNAPFYRRAGFAEIEPPAYLAPVLERERVARLDLGGRRVTMARTITPGVEPRPAVSVIPVRDGAAGLEVFVQHRVSTMDFAPGAVVFPGGRIDPVDAQNPAPVSEADLVELLSVWGSSTYVRQSDDPRLAVRTVLATGLREMAEETGVRLDPVELLPWDDWTTPPGFPKRFQVHFMVAHLPATDPRSPMNTTTEALESEWLTVREVLDRGNGGDLQVMTPTRVILQELADLGSAQAVMNAHPQVTPVHRDRSGRRPRPSRRPAGAERGGESTQEQDQGHER